MSLLLLGDSISDDDCIYFEKSVQGILKDYDNVICNLEGPIINYKNKSVPTPKVGPNIGQEKKFIDLLISSGIENFCLANNHIFDFGVQPVEETLSYFVKRKCQVTGICIDGKTEPIIIQDGNKEFCILNLCETHNSNFSSCNNKTIAYASLFDESIFALIEGLKTENRVIIASIHAGIEAVDVPLPFFRNVYKRFIDNGVDFVICHHPHIIQGLEIYKTGKIYYSIGDFIFRHKGIKRHNSIGCGIGLKYINGDLKVYHHYFQQNNNGEIKLSKKNLILESSKQLNNENYCKIQFENAYKKQILPIKFFSEGKLSLNQSLRNNLSLIFRSIFMPKWTRLRKLQYKLHLKENESYRELEMYIRNNDTK